MGVRVLVFPHAEPARLQIIARITEKVPNLAYLSIGSNIEPEKNLPAAVQALARFGTVRAVSSVWETAPVGFRDQPNFLNAAVILETELSAAEVRAVVCRSIEQALHRVRTENPNAPRTIDVDLSLFNHEVLALADKQIPDPDILTHAFVAVPLAEIAPAYRHPLTGQTLREIAQQLQRASEGIAKRDDVALI